ncbi:M20/M25/M40 family metallo-hydrolase [Candidatus Uhrbacteria bacterium]|nr:M20/M25/M40 family metallo-hydrolase [Candidatus Uhrbacteria bacterium]
MIRDMPDINEILKISQDLIRIKSTKDRPQDIGLCLDYAEKCLKDTSLTIKRFESNGVPSLVATKSGTKAPKIFLNGHLDVIEAHDKQFEPKIEDGKLIARGASDMKSAVAIMLVLMKELHTTHDIGLMLVGDEESGGFNGTKYLLDQGYTCQAAIIPDGGTAIQNIMHKAKGAMWVELTATGQAAHASRPWQGENAINKLLLAIDRVHNLFLNPTKHSDDHWATTCNIGNIRGGDSANVVPSHAVAVCDIRHIENDNQQSILRRIQNSLPDGVTAKQTVEVESLFVKDDDPYLIAYQEAIRSIGREPRLCLDHGASDARFFGARGIPTLISVPDSGGNHTENEWVSINALEDFAKMLKYFLNKITK